MREAGFDDEAEGVRIAGKVVNNLRYADDTTLLAGKKETLKNNIRKLRLESEKAGLYFNINKIQPVKTKFFTIIHLVSYNASYEAVTSTNI